MTTHEAIITKLNATVALVALVGSRIYSTSVPDGTAAPLVVMQQISGIPASVHVGASGCTERVFQFVAFGNTSTEARAVRDLIIEALDGVTLANGDTPTLQDERDGDVDDRVNVYRADADFFL